LISRKETWSAESNWRDCCPVEQESISDIQRMSSFFTKLGDSYPRMSAKEIYVKIGDVHQEIS